MSQSLLRLYRPGPWLAHPQRTFCQQPIERVVLRRRMWHEILLFKGGERANKSLDTVFVISCQAQAQHRYLICHQDYKWCCFRERGKCLWENPFELRLWRKACPSWHFPYLILKSKSSAQRYIDVTQLYKINSVCESRSSIHVKHQHFFLTCHKICQHFTLCQGCIWQPVKYNKALLNESQTQDMLSIYLILMLIKLYSFR